MNGISLEGKTVFVALLVGLAHIISGIAVLANSNALDVTPLASLSAAASSMGFQHGFVGAILLGAGIMAVTGSNLNIALPRMTHGVLFLPQQVLLLFQVWTINTALALGHYPNGYIPEGGSWFILTDQVWAWVLAVSHSTFLAAFIYGGRPDGHRDAT
jgi:hypothetical protein